MGKLGKQSALMPTVCKLLMVRPQYLLNSQPGPIFATPAAADARYR
jgi:hypothetical protein